MIPKRIADLRLELAHGKGGTNEHTLAYDKYTYQDARNPASKLCWRLRFSGLRSADSFKHKV